MVDGNYIKINRSILEWEWYKNINTCRLFLHMLLKANWKDGKFEGKEIKRGSFVSSIKNLAFETALTEREIRTGITNLKKTGELTSKSTNKYTVFTVVNYNYYQSDDKQNDKRATNERQTNDKLTTTIEERKKERKEEVIHSANLELDAAIKDFIDYRKKTKSPMTDRAVQMLITKLCELSSSESEQIEILQQSIVNGWKGIFELKTESKKYIPKQNGFNSFPQREYSKSDMSIIEAQIIAKQRGDTNV